VVAPCRVQGAGAAGEIAGAIADLNRLAVAQGGIDLILVSRGGGSLEDLWAFNEEMVARGIHASALPVVSGVGHEIDFTIADFTADLRAATPSAAAELITEGIFSSREFVADAAELLGARARRGLERREESLEWLGSRLRRVHPRTLLERHTQRLDEFQAWLEGRGRAALKSKQASLQEFAGRLRRVRPAEIVARRRVALEQLRLGVQSGARRGLEWRRTEVAGLAARLELLSPSNTLKRGYSITTFAESGNVVRRAGDAPPGTRLKTTLADGEILSVSASSEAG
jgi:exodeoxyribonuclease VII large subunit